MTIKITANGNFPITERGQATIIAVSGTFSTAAIVLTYQEPGGAFIPLTGGVLVVDEQYDIDHNSLIIFVTVTGADGSTDVDIVTSTR